MKSRKTIARKNEAPADLEKSVEKNPVREFTTFTEIDELTIEQTSSEVTNLANLWQNYSDCRLQHFAAGR